MKAITAPQLSQKAASIIDKWAKRSAPKHPDPAVSEEDLRQVGMLIWSKIEGSDTSPSTVLNCLSRSLKNHMIDVYRQRGRRPVTLPLEGLTIRGETFEEGRACSELRHVDLVDLAENGPSWFRKLVAHAASSDRHLHYLGTSNEYACRHAGLDPTRDNVREMVASLIGPQ